MLKCILLTLIAVFLICEVKSQQRDSSIFYYRYNDLYPREVSTLDSADYLRIVLSPDSGGTLYTSKEYYKNGQNKLFGKFNLKSNSALNKVSISFIGDVVEYYPNGKKYLMTHYDNSGYREGNQLEYYPDGTLYCCLKWEMANSFIDKFVYWDCYDAKGTKICSEGNGNWINYDPEFKKVLLSGSLKKGLREGEWHGITADSIKYLYVYHKDKIVSAVGYDKLGKSYPFEEIASAANYKGGPITFIRIFKNHLKLPKGENKSSLNGINISFIVEKDGRLTSFEILGVVSQELRDALNDAIKGCHDWLPSTYYGVPLRTQIILPLTFVQGYTGSGRYDQYREELNFQEKILGF